MKDLALLPPFKAFPLEHLLKVKTPKAPEDFYSFWQEYYKQIVKIRPKISLQDANQNIKTWRVIDLYFHSTDEKTIGGWILLPKNHPPKRGFVIGHGYGGRNAPDTHLPFEDSVLFFPCCRGISRSYAPPISSDPQWHVIHDIDKKDEYIIKGCVADTWLSISCIEQLFPYLSGKLGYLGISFSGGIGALALACEKRIAKAHLNVPTFGNHKIRLRMDTLGSGKSVRQFFNRHPRQTLRTLRYYDAANAAESIEIPMHFALALKDSYVCPPGQFAIYNAVKSEKQLFVFDEGHADFPRKAQQDFALLRELEHFFSTIY